MPGLFGLIDNELKSRLPVFEAMFEILRYGRAVHGETYRSDQISLGCVHLATGGERPFYESTRACVAFLGHLTEPAVPPGTGADGPNAAARRVHDRYLAHGERAFENLRGAYAVAIWDKHSRVLLLGGDRLGLRPIYYAEHRKGLRFASEVKAILVDPTFPRRLDRVAAADFFHFRHIVGQRTFFEDIHLLPPGSYLRWHDGRWSIVRYWTPTYPESFPKRPDSWYDEQIATTLQDAVRRTVRRGLRYGISLSSGMDSRWMAAVLGDIHPGTQAFTFQGTISSPAEAETARRVAELTGLEHHCQILSPRFVADTAETIAFISDGMQSLTDGQEFPLVLEMSRHVDVAVGGFMGSGFFGHNPVYYFVPPKAVFSFQKQRAWSRLPPRSVRERIFGAENYRELENLALEELRAANAEAPARLGFQILAHENVFHQQRRFTFSAQLLKTPYVDMVHPIADSRVWDLSLQFPPDQLMFKRALRRALGRFHPQLAALPWNKTPGPATASVSMIFLRQACSRIRGHGSISSFQDYSDWFRGPLRSFVEPVLLSDEAGGAPGLFDPSGFRGVVEDYFAGRVDITSFIGVALPFILWTKMFYLPALPKAPTLPVNMYACVGQQ